MNHQHDPGKDLAVANAEAHFKRTGEPTVAYVGKDGKWTAVQADVYYDRRAYGYHIGMASAVHFSKDGTR